MLDRLQAGQGEGAPGDLAAGTDVAVERRVRSRAELAANRAGHASNARAARRLGRPLRRAAGAAAGRAARRRGRGGASLGRGVPEQLAEHADGGDAVGHGVVDAADQGGAASGERHHVDPPQRPRVVQALGEQLAGQHSQLGAVQRVAVRDLRDVPGEVRVGIYPGGGGRGRIVHSPAQPGQRLDALADALAQALDVERAALVIRAQHQHLAGVALDRVGLQAQDLGVVEAELLGHG